MTTPQQIQLPDVVKAEYSACFNLFSVLGPRVNLTLVGKLSLNLGLSACYSTPEPLL